MTFKRFNQLPLKLIFQFFNWKLFKFHNRISCCSFHSRDGWCGWWKTTQHNFLRLWMGISFEWILIPSLSFKWIKFENYDDSQESKAALLELNFIFFVFLVCTHRRLAANNYLFRHLKPCKMIHSFFSIHLVGQHSGVLVIDDKNLCGFVGAHLQSICKTSSSYCTWRFSFSFFCWDSRIARLNAPN